MAWTALKTQAVGDPVIAADWNTHIRDNLNETAVAKVTTAGDIVYATGANALARLAKGTAGQVLRMNSGLTAPEWAALAVSQGATGTVAWAAQNVWTTGLSVSITPPNAGGRFLVLGGGSNGLNAVSTSIRCGVGAAFGTEEPSSYVGSGTGDVINITGATIIANASAAAQTAALQYYTSATSGNVLTTAWLIVIWMP